MHGSTNFKSPPTFAEIHCSCDNKLMKGKALRKHSLHVKTAASVYYKEEVRFLLYILGQIVSGQYIPNPLD